MRVVLCAFNLSAINSVAAQWQLILPYFSPLVMKLKLLKLCVSAFCSCHMKALHEWHFLWAYAPWNLLTLLTTFLKCTIPSTNKSNLLCCYQIPLTPNGQQAKVGGDGPWSIFLRHGIAPDSVPAPAASVPGCCTFFFHYLSKICEGAHRSCSNSMRPIKNTGIWFDFLDIEMKMRNRSTEYQ